MIRNVRTTRAAFTLIELLMVIAIIGVLVSLLMAAVFKIAGKGEETSARSDISQLAQGIAAFQSKYSVPYIPSRIRLSQIDNYDVSLKPDGTPNNPLDFHSKQFLTRVWPRLTFPLKNPWSGNLPVGTDTYLEGQESIVLFLGGIPSVINGALGCNGFSTNPRDPTDIAVGTSPPFFTFKSSRLMVLPGRTYLSYKDAFDKAPYAYFSAYKSSNGYNYISKWDKRSDCSSLGVWPYAFAITVPLTLDGKYVNPDSFQIVCAGSDGVFGTGTAFPSLQPIWIPKQPVYQSGGNGGYDDMSNFHDKLLGIPD